MNTGLNIFTVTVDDFKRWEQEYTEAAISCESKGETEKVKRYLTMINLIQVKVAELTQELGDPNPEFLA